MLNSNNFSFIIHHLWKICSSKLNYKIPEPEPISNHFPHSINQSFNDYNANAWMWGADITTLKFIDCALSAYLLFGGKFAGRNSALSTYFIQLYTFCDWIFLLFTNRFSND